MKKGLLIAVIILATLSIFSILSVVSFVSAQDENQTPVSIKCYSSKDCPSTAQYWCDGNNACQKLSQCINPGTPESACTVVDDCANCINMGYLGCKDGQCKKIDCNQDSDCGIPASKKYCSGMRACAYQFTPHCQNPGTIDSSCISASGESCTPCAYSCSEGVCRDIVKPTTCTDSDNGLDYYKQGETCTNDGCEKDRCVGNGITLIEYFCNGNERSLVDYACEKCENGACVTGTTPTPGCVQKGTTCCKGDACVGIACQQGYTSRFNGCDSNCAPVGTCQSTETVSEQVKCVFKNSKVSQKCYLSEYNDRFSCAGTETCVMDIRGANGAKMTWKSTCGGYAYTTLDGNSEYAEFDCSEKTDTCQPTLCADGSKTGCYKDEKGYSVCSTCPPIVIKPVCGNGVCESGEWQVCEVAAETCKAGEKCEVSQAKCHYGCEQDCKTIPGVQAKLNEKFKLQVGQTVKILDYKEIKITFRDLLTPSCEPSVTNTAEVKQKLTGMAVAEETPATATTTASGGGGGGVSIMKCPEVGPGPMAQLEIVNPEEMGNKILTLKAGEAKNIYDVSVSFLDYDFASRTGVFVVNSETSTCPEHCKCDNTGFVLECRTKEKCEQGKMLCPDGKCKEKCEINNLTLEECKSGCIYGDKCLPIGVRVKGIYCNIDTTLTNQLGANEKCDNNFECTSNVCVSGQCISEGFIRQIINWFRNLFGG